MSYYYYFLLVIVLSFILLLIRSLILRRKNIPVLLFTQALKNENSGDFEGAVAAYESALDEAEKSGFNNGLKNKINAKLKLLHALIKYEKDLRFIR